LAHQSVLILRHCLGLAPVLWRHRKTLSLTHGQHPCAEHLLILVQRLPRTHRLRLIAQSIILLEEVLKHLLIDAFIAFKRVLELRLLGAIHLALAHDQRILNW
jgi:hypothetical protein